MIKNVLVVFKCILNKVTKMDRVHLCLRVCGCWCFWYDRPFNQKHILLLEENAYVTLGDAYGLRVHVAWTKEGHKVIFQVHMDGCGFHCHALAINCTHLTPVAPKLEKLILNK